MKPDEVARRHGLWPAFLVTAPVAYANRFRTAFLATLLAMAAVLLLQPLFVFALIQVRSHTDLASARLHVLAAFDEGVLDDEQQPRLFINRGGHQFTECTALNLMLDDGQNFLTTALMPRLHFEFVDPCPELHKTAAGIAAPVMTDYSRYWHGYRIYMWPLLERFNLQSVRFINAFLTLCALTFFYCGLRGAIGPTPAFIFFVVLMSLTDIWRIWVNTPHFIAMFIILVGSAAFVYVRRKTANGYAAIVCAAVLGSVFNFFDFLSSPPMMPMLLSFFVLAARDDSGTTQCARGLHKLPLAMMVAASWFGGYAMTWLVKWILVAYLSTDAQQTILGITDQILLRLYGQEPNGHIYFLPLLPTLTMIIQSFISVGSVTVAVLATAIVLHLHKNWASFDKRVFVRLLLPTLIPIIWFELLSNHTQTHSHFAYRSESAAIALVFAAAIMATNPPTNVRLLLGNLRGHLWRAALLRRLSG